MLLFFLLVESVKMTKKRPKFGVLPLLNMPQKSHQSVSKPARPLRSVVSEESLDYHLNKAKTSCYKNFPDFCKRAQALKSMREWCIKVEEDRIVLKKAEGSPCLPELELIVGNSLGFTVIVYGWLLPDDHILYTEYLRSMKNITLRDLVKVLTQSCIVCPGIEQFEMNSNIIHHSIPKSVDPLNCDDNEPTNISYKEYWRSRKCLLLVQSVEHCPSYHDQSYTVVRATKAKQRRMSQPAHLNAPVSKTAPDTCRLKLTSREQRLRCVELKH